MGTTLSSIQAIYLIYLHICLPSYIHHSLRWVNILRVVPILQGISISVFYPKRKQKSYPHSRGNQHFKMLHIAKQPLQWCQRVCSLHPSAPLFVNREDSTSHNFSIIRSSQVFFQIRWELWFFYYVLHIYCQNCQRFPVCGIQTAPAVIEWKLFPSQWASNVTGGNVHRNSNRGDAVRHKHKLDLLVGWGACQTYMLKSSCHLCSSYIICFPREWMHQGQCDFRHCKEKIAELIKLVHI